MSSKKEQILDLAERMTQTRGFNGFSYIDLSKQIGIKTSSIHYYFKSKDDLGIALINRAEEVIENAMNDFDRNIEEPKERLLAFAAIFKGLAMDDERFCLCGMMSAELSGLGPEARTYLNRYFQKVRAWLSKQFSYLDPENAHEKSIAFISMLEGGLLIARTEKNPEIIDQGVKIFIPKD